MASKRTYELIEKLTSFAEFFFLTDKLGETEAKKVSFETLNSVLVHDDMEGVNQAGIGVQDGHISDQAQDIEGIKNFLKSPTVPTPTIGLQAVNKDYVDAEQSHSITVTSDFFNTTDITDNALFTTDEVVFRLPYNCKILKAEIVLKSIDTGTVGTLNCKIKGQAGNVFNSAISLTTASNTDGSGGVSSTNVNALYNSGLKDTDLLFFIQAGTNANAGNGQLIITIQRTS